LAGAGTGKTRALIARVAYLMAEKGADPRSILALTFTNKAADELRERLVGLLGEGRAFPWAGTFHSFCARLLREFGEVLGYVRNFSIYDTDDSERVLAAILRQQGIARDELSPALLQNWVSARKNGREPASAKRHPFYRLLPEILDEYHAVLRQSQAMDFDDLLRLPIELFDAHPDILEKIQKRHRHILVDEYQDTNRLQYELVRRLAGTHRSLFVVGDDDQSIYGWRGADLRNILEFEKDFPDTVVFRLEQNYRSTEAILHVANDVIARNRARKEKRIWTSLQGGDKPILRVCRTDLDEAQEVVGEIFHLARKQGISWHAFAILYRTNAQSRPFEEALLAQMIPYRLVGAIRFYERKEIKDALSYLRVIVNPSDELSLRRLFGAPSRGIGSKTVSRLEQAAREGSCTLWETLKRLDEVPDLTAAAKIRLKATHDLIESFRQKTAALSVSELISELLAASGLRAQLQQEGTKETQERLDNLDQLVAGAEERCRAHPAMTLEDFLQEIALISDVDDWQDRAEAVTLMTLHSAKGLEFSYVFLVGLQEGLFPHERSGNGEAEIEEERRLFYVGVTRAQKRLYLTYATQRWQRGRVSEAEPSRFLREIHPENLQGWTLPPERRPGEREWWQAEEEEEEPASSHDSRSSRRRAKAVPTEGIPYRIGDLVEHPQFGR
ncbi:MAG: ATP-dependent DNA helicase PcrA, partial [Calditrichaeota bacterium]|nr:ATP-dependent DNA helicase PcrA [Calditrichota bacterium]